MRDQAKVAIVDDEGLDQSEKLARVVATAGLWNELELKVGAAGPAGIRIVIAPEFGAFEMGSPVATDPKLVEALIDLLHDMGYPDVAVCSSLDSSSLWAENRSVEARADLLGYKFVTPKQRPYPILDLSEDVDTNVFPPQSCLYGTGISRHWTDADFRMVFSKNRTDEQAGYALGLDSLIGVLPLPDKTLYYRLRRSPGEVVADLLASVPVDFAFIDAIVSGHGPNGRRAPQPLITGTLIGAREIVLADYAGALKTGLDPYISPLFGRVVRDHRLPLRFDISGSLRTYTGWHNVPTRLTRVTRWRDKAATVARIAEPWLQQLDSAVFPLKNPLDAGANARLAGFFRDIGDSPTSYALLTAANALFGMLARGVEAYRVLFDKDAIRRRTVSLGIGETDFPPDATRRVIDELEQLAPLVAPLPEAAPGLRWRYLNGAVIFSYARWLPIDFTFFSSRVDVARTIQFMNDYLGGAILPIEFDAEGRPVRQLERNIYLPQPNYLVLFNGKPIDVTKIEVVEYSPDRHRLFWKTVASENRSAIADDGVATWSREGGGTMVTFVGRQLFVLPLFWQVFDLRLVPELKAALVTDAYRTFFDRTVSNLEALVEGRDILLGQPIDEPSRNAGDELTALLRCAGQFMTPLLRQATASFGSAVPAVEEVDADGFTHVRPGVGLSREDSIIAAFGPWLDEMGRIIAGYRDASRRDHEAGAA